MNAAFFVAKHAFVSLSLIVFAISAISQTVSPVKKYDDHFARVEIATVSTVDSIYREVAEVVLTTQDRSLRLSVSPHDLRASFYRAEDTHHLGTSEIVRNSVNTYKGVVAGEVGSQVRLTISEGRIEGFFEMGTERFFVEPAIRYDSDARSGEYVVYRGEDVLHRENFWCTAEMPERIENGRSMAANGSSMNFPPFRRVDIATEADSQFVSLHGGASGANSEILSILNMAEGTFEAEVGIRFRVTFQHTWSSPDPFTGSNTDQLLRSFQAHWNANYGSVNRNTTHLFTGKSYAQSQGYAFLGVVCSNPAFAYGLSGFVGWAPGKFLVSAHEIAHNFGADHADSAQACTNSLMNTQLSGSTPLTFCQFSRNQIGGFVGSNGSCLSTISDRRTQFDFDGDGRADTGVYRPANGVWYLDRSSGGFAAFQFGATGDRIVSADFDGDGKTDPAIFRNGVWWRINSSTNAAQAVSFGLQDDIPAPADFDGDGRADLVVFRPSTGTWYRLNSSNGSFTASQFGMNGDRPIAADFDGDGRADLSMFRPSNGTWYRINSSNGLFSAVRFGLTGDVPLSADFDGDATTDIAVWRPTTGVWYWIRSSDEGVRATTFGMQGDVPAPADLDGDGTTDLNVFRPSTGVWYRLNSSNGAFSALQFGVNGDFPVSAN